MDLVDSRDRRWEAVSGHRDGSIEFKRLASVTGGPGAFEFALVRFTDRYRTPRHRHNYDQVRFQLHGALDYGPGRELPEGAVGYFPEGTAYGPQDVTGPVVTLALQCGGASGHGFLDYAALSRGHRELADAGEFRDGVYRTVAPDGRTVTTDGYQAIWEHVHGTPMRREPGPLAEPAVVLPAAHRYRAVPGAAGVARRRLGSFTDAHTELATWAWDAGAELLLPARAAGQLLYVLRGTLTTPAGTATAHAALHLRAGESAPLLAGDAGAEAFWIGLPLLDDPVVDLDPTAPDALPDALPDVLPAGAPT